MTAALTAPLHEMQSPSGRACMIDIGSNSIRMVIYDALKRSPVPLYNEKVMCQLGKNLASTGKLHAEGVKMAEEAVRRYLALTRSMEVTSLFVMATAAVRDASDGPEFTKRLEEEHGITIDTISGEKEARLGAYGILGSMHAPRGVAGDLGGGSMELIHMRDSGMDAQVTLPIGPLRLLDETGGDRDKVEKRVNQALERVSWLGNVKAESFYAIGGSFRAIGKLHMEQQNYPLKILHEYSVPGNAFIDYVRELTTLSEEKLLKLPGMPAKRVSAVPVAATILRRVLEELNPKQVVFSASGIREGYLYEKLAPHLRAQDVLIASCLEIAARGTQVTYAQELMQWMQPLFGEDESEEDYRLRLAFCLLSDVAHHMHPEYRAEGALQRILHSALTGITHVQRVQLSLALYHRYQFKLKAYHPALELLNDEQRQWARLVGAAANLAYHLTGSIPGTLEEITLHAAQDGIGLAFARGREDLMGEAIARRINGLDEAYRKWVG